MKLKQYSIDDLLGTHPIDDPIWDYDNDSMDLADSAEDLAGMYNVWDGYAKSDVLDNSDETLKKDKSSEANVGLTAIIEVPGQATLPAESVEE